MAEHKSLASKLNEFEVTLVDASILSYVSQHSLLDKKMQKSIEDFYHKLSKNMTPDGRNVAEYCLGYDGEYSHAVKTCGDHLINWWRDRFERYNKEHNKKEY